MIEATGGARLGIVILAVADLARARAFYESAFGWAAEVDTAVYVEFRLPAGMRVGIYERAAFGRNVGQAPDEVRAGSVAPTELYLFPDDHDATEARLLAAGGRRLSALARRDWGDDVAYFADPDGTVIALARSPAG
jgi:predicted enzyme related to lactoylglutathione lyase